MAGLGALDETLFPLKSIADVVNFFRNHLENCQSEPDLTLLSILAGFIEITLTSAAAARFDNVGTGATEVNEKTFEFPIITFEIVETLYTKFRTALAVIDKPKGARNANRQVIKRISDIIYYSLFRSSYKDRAHLQSLYSYLCGNKLDSFGVAFAVVAGCQLLGYKDVHLAISEDHAWVILGKNRTETIEVTWHGKGIEDKRGQDVSAGIQSRSWLYLSGHAVICDRFMEVAAIVSAINISIIGNTECAEVAELQQKLLWLLYDMNHLQKYPMGLGNLGELEEVSPTEGRPNCEYLYKEAIKSAQNSYNNHHIYPYTYLGGYYYRLNKYRETFASWANAADVIRLYTYNSRDDEEIYKEFFDIANEIIPFIMKTESSGHSARSILRDSECFANLLRFYDGICQWEEGSLTPILHIGWAKPLVNTISKYDYDIRSQVVIHCADDDDIYLNAKKFDTNEAKKENGIPQQQQIEEGNNNCIKKDDQTKANDNSALKKSEMPTTLADLTAACGEKILNPDFLLQGGGQPFASDQKQNNSTESNDTEMEVESNLNKIEEVKENEIMPKAISPPPICDENSFDFTPKRPVITLYSQKMKGLKDLLISDKLNTHAISLQVTAQSQVAAKKCRTGDKSLQSHNVASDSTDTNSSRPKRTRRE